MRLVGGTTRKVLVQKYEDQSLDPQNLCKKSSTVMNDCNPSTGEREVDLAG